jgi:hypothetical protein
MTILLRRGPILIDLPAYWLTKKQNKTGMLQRLSEELEYSELLDKASETEDPYERMVLIAAFAVSAYGSSHVRAGHKPFNPLLGETYECVREDKGFKYIGEQVGGLPHSVSPFYVVMTQRLNKGTRIHL